MQDPQSPFRVFDNEHHTATYVPRVSRPHAGTAAAAAAAAAAGVGHKGASSIDGPQGLNRMLPAPSADRARAGMRG